jgi:hypothetical protein
MLSLVTFLTLLYENRGFKFQNYRDAGQMLTI